MVPRLDWDSPGLVSSEFLKDDSFVRGLRGPLGSGKSVTCCIEVLRRSMAQAPDRHGVRPTRWAVVRNTNPELRTTTIKTWREWIGDEWGAFRWAPPYTHSLKFELADRTVVESEVVFLALDRGGDVKKLLSNEFTGGWINEAREVGKEIVDALTSRLPRYPPPSRVLPTWGGLIMDTNSPAEDHWWAVMSGDVPPPEWMTEDERRMLVRPQNWRFFSQSGAVLERFEGRELVGYDMNPARENQRKVMPDGRIVGLPDSYYQNMIPGKTRGWISVYLRNRYGSLKSGKPVFPTFRHETHVAAQRILPTPGLPVMIGLDFGRTPAAVFAQVHPGGRWAIFHELCAVNMGIRRFCHLLKREIATLGIVAFELECWGDPAGDELSQSSEDTPIKIMRNEGIVVRPAPSNDPTVRIEAMEQLLERLVDGRPAFQVSPHCTTLIAGFEGGYQYRQLDTTGTHYDEKAEKNRFSHPQDGLQYVLLGGGEGRMVLTGRREASRPVTVQRASSPLERMRMGRLRKGSFRGGFGGGLGNVEARTRGDRHGR